MFAKLAIVAAFVSVISIIFTLTVRTITKINNKNKGVEK